MDDLIIGVGKKLKEIRKRKELLLSDVAHKASVSVGLISKVENGRTIPSLPVLVSIVSALDEELGPFFNSIDSLKKEKYTLIKADKYENIEKEPAPGFLYSLIHNQTLNSLGFEIVLLSLKSGASREPTTTDAFEYKYILDGEVVYHIEEQSVQLCKGDSIYFDGRIPHYPENISKEFATMLVVYFYINP